MVVKIAKNSCCTVLACPEQKTYYLSLLFSQDTAFSQLANELFDSVKTWLDSLEGQSMVSSVCVFVCVCVPTLRLKPTDSQVDDEDEDVYSLVLSLKRTAHFFR